MSEVSESQKKAPRVGEKDSHDFPEGGRGWFVLLGMWIIMGLSYGLINAYGEYQAYYTTKFPTTNQSILTLIGSLQPFLIYMSSIPAVAIINKLGARFAVSIGGTIMVFALMMISISKQVWQLYLAQGIVFGFGCGLCVFVAFSLPQQWFKKKRALAVGLCASGSSLGGMLWPIAFNKLLDQVGFQWANRIIGFIYIPLVVIAVFATKSRATDPPPVPPASTDPSEVSVNNEDLENQIMTKSELIPQAKEQEKEVTAPSKRPILGRIFHKNRFLDWTVLNDYHFALFLSSNFIAFFALFPPLFFLPSFAHSMNASPNITKYILTMANAGSILGRILPGFLGDKIGRLNSLIPCLAFSGLFPLVFWLPARGDALLIIFAIAFGISSGAVVSLGPATIGQLFGVSNLKSRLSLFLMLSGPGSLAGAAIAGSFLPTSTNSGIQGYDKLIIYVSVLFFASAAVLLVLRLTISRKLFAFV